MAPSVPLRTPLPWAISSCKSRWGMFAGCCKWGAESNNEKQIEWHSALLRAHAGKFASLWPVILHLEPPNAASARLLVGLRRTERVCALASAMRGEAGLLEPRAVSRRTPEPRASRVRARTEVLTVEDAARRYLISRKNDDRDLSLSSHEFAKTTQVHPRQPCPQPRSIWQTTRR